MTTSHPWVLYLDDEREPTLGMYSAVKDAEFVICRSTKEAINAVLYRGSSDLVMMFLDHDLGGDDTSMKFLRWLSEYDPIYPTRGRQYIIHSENPVGRANIHAFISSWKRLLQP